jgi:predicted 3-demethylubiquinone-9 3-methyltransferase (glyoxalase superfamily)
MNAKTQSVSTCFWFDRDGEEAARFYVSLFPNSEILSVSRYGHGMPLPPGTALVTVFTLDGVGFSALNGGPVFKQSAAASFVALCENQAEIDRLWRAFLENGGRESQCGWLTDRWGVAWQIVPRALDAWLGDPDLTRVTRVMNALMPMKKLDIAALEQAHRQAA